MPTIKKEITREEFYDEFDKLKPAVNQRGRDIASESGISYGTYLTYVRGLGANPEIMNKILDAARAKAIELRNTLNELEL